MKGLPSKVNQDTPWFCPIVIVMEMSHGKKSQVSVSEPNLKQRINLKHKE